MKKYFNIPLEFSKTIIINLVNNHIAQGKKGYICVVDGNVLATANKDKLYNNILNNALANTCDGSSIAFLAGKIHRKDFSTYTGPEIFAEYIKSDYKQYFLGNTDENLKRLKAIFTELDYNVDQFKFESLPFRKVEDFDYMKIAKNINNFCPDIIWVSLGAPKQEFFINNLYPFINKGVLFGIGAAFNLYLNDKDNKRAPQIMRKIHIEWVYRVFQEPKRIGKRALDYFILLPKLIFEEIINTKRNKYN